MPALAKLLPRIDPAALARGLSRMSDADRVEFERLMEAQFGGEGLADFIRRTRPEEPPPRHLMPLIDVFDRARQGGGLRVLVSMPPRAGKSITVRSGLTWWLTHSPADTNAYCSYNQDIAREQSYLTRDEARDAGIALAPDHQSADDWKTTEGGGLLAAGTGTALTGRGVHGVAVVDDPFKDDVEANSSLMRKRVWTWFNRVVRTRLEGFASIVVVHTRWHGDDLIGRLMKEGGWEVINVQALADNDNDPLGRARGEPFWPERPQFTAEALEKIRSVDGHGFASLYQGEPRAKGARVFKMPPAFYPAGEKPPSGWQVVIGVDPAATKKTTADFSVAVVMAIKRGVDINGRPAPELTRARILEVLRRQSEVPAFARECLALQRRWYGAPLVVEAVGGFRAVPQIMREAAPGALIYELNGNKLGGDKFQRAQGFASAWNQDRVEVPQGAPWLRDYLAELEAFTGVGDAKDDQVDGSSHCWGFIARTPIPGRRGSVAAPDAYG